jgi:hypothetical protein
MALVVTPTLTLETRKPDDLSGWQSPRGSVQMYALNIPAVTSLSETRKWDDVTIARTVSQRGTQGTPSFPRRLNCIRIGCLPLTLGAYHRTVHRLAGRVYAERVPSLKHIPYAYGQCRHGNRDHPVHPELGRHGPLLRPAINAGCEVKETHAEERLLIVSTSPPRVFW